MMRPQKWGVGFFLVCFLCLWFFGIGGAFAADPAPASNKKPPASTEPAPAGGASENPSIQIPQPIFDFGEVIEGAEIVHEFVIKNTGRAELVINQVRPG